MPEKDEREEDGVSDSGVALIGESFIGEGGEAAHVSTVLGQQPGAVEATRVAPCNPDGQVR